MLLYHGTSERVAKLALKQGLWPRRDLNGQGNWDHTVESSPVNVYLTRAYAPYFAAQKSEEDERWAIIQIDTKGLCMTPDEDFLEQATRGMCAEAVGDMAQVIHDYDPRQRVAEDFARRCPNGDINRRTAWFRDNLSHFSHLWEISVDKLGNAANIGQIPRFHIQKIALFDPESNPYVAGACMDPTITIINYHFCGAKYRNLTDWFFVHPELIGSIARTIAGVGTAEADGELGQMLKAQREYAEQQLANRDGVEVIENEDFYRG